MHLRQHVGPLGAAAAVLLAATTGCAALATPNTQAGACESAGVTPDQVKIGYIYPNTGLGSESFLAARAGVDARLGLANEEGGVNGRKIVYEWRDDEASVTGNSHAAQDLVERESVFGLVTTSTVMAGSADYLDRRGVPVTGLVAEQVVWTVHSNMFSRMYSASVGTQVRYIQQNNGSRPAILIADGANSANDIAADTEQSIRDLGMTPAGTIAYAPGSDSAQRVARQIADSGADSLIGILAPDALIGIVQAVRAMDLPIHTIVSPAGYDQRLVNAVGSIMAGVSFPAVFRPFEAQPEIPAMHQFRDAMSRFAPQIIPTDQAFAMLAYIDTDLFLRGLEEAGTCPTRESFITGLRAVTDYDAGGLVEPTNMKDDAGKPLPCYGFVRINAEGTEFEVVNDRLCEE